VKKPTPQTKQKPKRWNWPAIGTIGSLAVSVAQFAWRVYKDLP
jgi:hypothetical protein